MLQHHGVHDQVHIRCNALGSRTIMHQQVHNPTPPTHTCLPLKVVGSQQCGNVVLIAIAVTKTTIGLVKAGYTMCMENVIHLCGCFLCGGDICMKGILLWSVLVVCICCVFVHILSCTHHPTPWSFTSPHTPPTAPLYIPHTCVSSTTSCACLRMIPNHCQLLRQCLRLRNPVCGVCV